MRRESLNKIRVARALALGALLAFAAPRESPAQSTWTWRNPLPHGNAFSSLAWNGSILVAAGAQGIIYTTTDTSSFTWTSRVSGTDKDFTSVIWTGSEFIAMGADVISKSPDGLTWMAHGFGGGLKVSDIAWADTQFVAVGGNNVFTSVDAISWTSHDIGLGASSALYVLTWTGTRFIALGRNGTSSLVRWSTDGVSWSPGNMGNTSYMQHLVWTGSRAIACGGLDLTISTDSTGVNWNALRLPSACNGAAWTGNQAFIFCTGGEILTSSDGAIWKTQKAADFAYSRAAAGVESQTVVVGSVGHIMTTRDTVWTRRYSAVTQKTLHSLAFSGSRLVALGDDQALTSSDGITWTPRSTGVNPRLRAMTWTGSQFVAVGDSGTIVTSPDGENWIQRTSGTTSNLAFVTWKAGTIVAGPIPAGGGSFASLLSTDGGTSWSFGTPGAGSLNIAQAVWADTQFVGVGSGGTYASPDGVAWRKISTYAANAIAWSGNHFVAVGGAGLAATSPDGVAWNQKSLDAFAYTLKSVIWTGSRFVAVGLSRSMSPTGNTAFSSEDGNSWTQTAFPGPGLNSVAWTGHTFVAVGTGGAILTASEDSLPPKITVVAPNGGESWTGGSTQEILWNSARYSAPVRIELSLDEGGSWSTIAPSAANSGSYTWNVPDSASSHCRIRVSGAVGGIPSDMSDTSFSMLFAPAKITLLTPNGGELRTLGQQDTIRWTSSSAFTGNVRIDVSRNGGATWTNLAGSAPNTGSFPWTPDSASPSYRISVGNASGNSPSDTSDANFTILPPPPTLANPWNLQASWTTGPLTGIVWTGTQAVVVGRAPNNTDGIFLTSPEGKTWTLRATLPSKPATEVTWTGDQLVAVGSGGLILTSSDGIAWTERTSGVTNDLNSVTWTGTGLVAVGNGAVLTSPDGITWSKRTSHGLLYKVIWDGSKLVAGGGGISVSPANATDWMDIAAPGGAFYGLAWTGAKEVAVGGNTTGNISVSPPGAGSWSLALTDAPRSFSAVGWSGNQLVAVGGQGMVYSSPNGAQWTPRNSGTTTSLADVAWTGKLWIAVGNGGAIYTSAEDSTTTSTNAVVNPPVGILPGSFVFRVTGADKPYTFILPAGVVGVEKVTLSIGDLRGRTLWAKSVTPSKDGKQTEIAWNGRASKGSLASAGMYVARIAVQSTAGVTTTYVRKVVTLKP